MFDRSTHTFISLQFFARHIHTYISHSPPTLVVPLPLRTPTGPLSHGMVTRGARPTARPRGDDSRRAISITIHPTVIIVSPCPTSSRLALPRLACPASSRPAQPHLASHCLECLYCDHDKCAVVVCCAHRHIYLGPVYITSSCSSFALVLVVCFSFALVLWVLEGPAESDMFMLCALALPTPVADRTGAFWRRKQFRTSRSVSGRYARVGGVSHRFEHCADTFKHGVSDHTIFR